MDPQVTLRIAVQYDVEDLPSLGWLVLTHQGEENTYFLLPDGSPGFVKVLLTDYDDPTEPEPGPPYDAATATGMYDRQ